MAVRELFRSKKPQQGVEVVADLDALLEKPVAFRFMGVAYIIEPMKTKDCLSMLQEFSKIDALAKQPEITGTQVIDSYVDLFGKVCPKFGRAQVEKMTPAQLAALFALVVETVTGKVHTAAAEKKTLPSPTPGSSES